MITIQVREALMRSTKERKMQMLKTARERIRTIESCRKLLAAFVDEADPAVLDDLIVKMGQLKPTDLRFFQKAIEVTQRIHTIVNDQYYVIGSNS